MDTRTLWAIGLALGAAAIWYYRLESPDVLSVPVADWRLDYSARDIRLLQTTPSGQLEALTEARALYHYAQPEQTRLEGLTSRWYEQGQLRAELTAAQATANADYQQIQLSGGVRVNQPALQEGATGPGSAGTQVSTATLTGYPRQKIIATQSPVEIQSGTSIMRSQGLHADLRSGQYQLQAPRIRYVPSR